MGVTKQLMGVPHGNMSSWRSIEKKRVLRVLIFKIIQATRGFDGGIEITGI